MNFKSEPLPISTRKNRSALMTIQFQSTAETHKILMALACHRDICLSEAMQMILDDWRKLFVVELEAWKTRGSNNNQAIVQLSAPAWVRKEKKRQLRLYLTIESSRDIAVGQAMTLTKKSDFLREIILYWASLHTAEIGALMERRGDYLKNRAKGGIGNSEGRHTGAQHEPFGGACLPDYIANAE